MTTILPSVNETPIGVRYCVTHNGLRELDDSNGCDFRDDDDQDDCQFVELFPGTEVVEVYHDPWDDDEDDDDETVTA